MSALWFILGGSRSGKSARGESIANDLAGGDPVIYVATCRTEGIDVEMQARIQKHQSTRPAGWITVENQFDLAELAASYPGQIILIDCLTLWLSHWSEKDAAAEITAQRLKEGLRALAECETRTIIVSNELGMGLIPDNPASRAYRDLVGTANQIVAGLAGEVELVVAGIPVTIKSQGKNTISPK